MSEIYAKSRRAYLVTAGLLLLWGFVGLKVTKISALGVDLSVQQGQLLPLVFVVVLAYLAFRVTWDWMLSGSRSQNMIIDLTVTHVLASIGLLAYVARLIWEGDFSVVSVLLGVLAGWPAGVLVISFIADRFELLGNLLEKDVSDSIFRKVALIWMSLVFAVCAALFFIWPDFQLLQFIAVGVLSLGLISILFGVAAISEALAEKPQT